MKEISTEVEQLAGRVVNSIRVLTDRYIEWIDILYFNSILILILFFYPHLHLLLQFSFIFLLYL
jgi:hypothetical protein